MREIRKHRGRRDRIPKKKTKDKKSMKERMNKGKE